MDNMGCLMDAVSIALFVLRILIAIALYAFLGVLLWVLLRDRPSPKSIAASSRLTLLLGDEDGRTYDIQSAAWIGRDPNCLVRADDDFASARHAQVLWRAEDGPHGAWWLEDNLSRNGTFVNEQRVTRTQLKNGDVIRVGRMKFRFEMNDMNNVNPKGLKDL